MKGFGKQIIAGLTVALFITTATFFVIYTAGFADNDQMAVNTANDNGSSDSPTPSYIPTPPPPTPTPAFLVLMAYAAGEGTGNVRSSTGGIDFDYPATTTGSEQLIIGSAVTITATGTNGSTAEWSGDCDSTGGTSLVATCTINGIWSTRNVTATFTPAPVRVGTTGYQDLQSAYDEATDMSVIEMLAGTLPGSLNASRPIDVTIKGGFDTTYTTNSGITIMQGVFTLWNGSLTVERVGIE